MKGNGGNESCLDFYISICFIVIISVCLKYERLFGVFLISLAM